MTKLLSASVFIAAMVFMVRYSANWQEELMAGIIAFVAVGLFLGE